MPISFSRWLSAALIAALAVPALGQGPQPGCAIRATSAYVASGSGDSAVIRNRLGMSYNFSVGGVRIPMADPTITRIKVGTSPAKWTYYVTGTSDHYNTANF